MTYEIYAALHDETDKGWVWLVKDGFNSGETIKLSNVYNGKSVYCVYRQIDENFLTHYNERPHTKNIDPEATYKSGERVKIKDLDKYKGLIVMGEWYRRRLGLTNKPTCCNVDVLHPRWPWASILAACVHPDAFVRLGTRLGILGAWLGISSLLLATLTLVPHRWCGFHWTRDAVIFFLLLLGGVCFFACGIKQKGSTT